MSLEEKRDSYSGIDISMTEAEGMTVTESQCANCKHEFGFDGCKIFGKAPNKYAYVSANVPCPKREEK